MANHPLLCHIIELNSLIVLCLDLEVTLVVEARGAAVGGFLAGEGVATLAALPGDGFGTVEGVLILHALEQTEVALLVLLLGHTDGAVHEGYILEALVLGDIGKGGVEVVPLLELADGGRAEVVHRGAYLSGRVGGADLHHAAFEELEHALGMHHLLLGGLLEDGGYLFVAFALGLLGKIGVAHAGL